MEGEIQKTVNRQWKISQTPSPGKLHPPSGKTWILRGLSLKFRERRALLIAWRYLPDDFLKWEIFLQLSEKGEYLDFKAKGLFLSIEYQLLLKDRLSLLLTCEEENFFTKRELFGTILQEDLRNALNSLFLEEVHPKKPRSLVRRKGYRDHGAMRPIHRWLESSDCTFTAEQEIKEKKQELIKLLTSLYFRKFLSNLEER